ncbi:hypothetical protein SAMN02927937_01789 [Paenimyroides aquimaris]|uniref:Uncharacterized protein n=1 Tax=Paenimyroides marinum TaxID=1159016 RepID=A0A1H6LKW9_9FLAO|nr:hypothetical protein [Paenimyroides aquimaris]SEH85454.1 hypothetical protein SAMN02927937_01789 [Paenimyroides aquimaris]
MNHSASKIKLSQIVFMISLFTTVYWLVAFNINVYAHTVTRVIFEMTSLLLMISLYTLPFLIIALILRLKKRTPKLHYVSLGLLLFLLILIFTVYQ